MEHMKPRKQKRTKCCVPFCTKLGRRLYDDDEEEEWFCTKHYNLASREAILEYDAAWHHAVKTDERRADGLDVPLSPYARVTKAWDRLKDEVLKAAMEGTD